MEGAPAEEERNASPTVVDSGNLVEKGSPSGGGDAHLHQKGSSPLDVPTAHSTSPLDDSAPLPAPPHPDPGPDVPDPDPLDAAMLLAAAEAGEAEEERLQAGEEGEGGGGQVSEAPGAVDPLPGPDAGPSDSEAGRRSVASPGPPRDADADPDQDPDSATAGREALLRPSTLGSSAPSTNGSRGEVEGGGAVEPEVACSPNPKPETRTHRTRNTEHET